MLNVDGLTKRYGARTVVNQVSFTVDPGTIMGLVGPNGAGKTTTLACVAGLVAPTAGRITWDSTPVLSQPGLVGMLPESPEVYPLLTVWEHLEFVARLFELGPNWHEEAESALVTWGLADQRDQLGANLSKGLRQRVGLAAAALRRARLLLVDEPMIGLDPKGQREVREMIRTLANEGTAIVLSSHQLAVIEALADDVVVMAGGLVRAHDTVQGLMAADEGASLEDVLLRLTESPGAAPSDS